MADIIEQQVREDDFGRYLCVQFAPPAARPAMLAVLGLALELGRVRERTIREPAMAAIRFAWWRDGVEAIFHGRPPPEPVLTDLAGAVAAHGLSRASFDTLLEAVQQEAEGAAPGLVAEAIGASPLLAWLEILNVRDAESAAAVRDAGAAWMLARREAEAAAALQRIARARTRRGRIDRRALPALLATSVAEALVKGRSPLRLQLTLLRRALIGRY